MPPILPPQDGSLPRQGKVPCSFAADVEAREGRIMAIHRSRGPRSTRRHKITRRRWNRSTSWYLVVTEDKMISARCTTLNVKTCRPTVVFQGRGSHAIYVSQQRLWPRYIERAAAEVQARRSLKCHGPRRAA